MTTTLTWQQLEAKVSPFSERDVHDIRVNGKTNAQATLRLFGKQESDVRVTLYRDHHAWCPYCQKIWLYLEEKQIPYRIRKVTMFCYGDKESWYKQICPSGMLPALELDGHLITESDIIMQALEDSFQPLGPEGMNGDQVYLLRQLERHLFGAWCDWLCRCKGDNAQATRAEQNFIHAAKLVENALEKTPGPFFLSEFSTADVIFIPYLERMNASLAYYKGYGLRVCHPSIDAWFTALEQRETYLGTQSDFHTHSHDLPPQMGNCFASGTPQQREVANLIDLGEIKKDHSAIIETKENEKSGAALEALSRVLRHRQVLLGRMSSDSRYHEIIDESMRAALTNLIEGDIVATPPHETAAYLRYLKDRISVPRDMSLHAARRLRHALETTASLDSSEQGPAIPIKNRRDQNPQPFVNSH